MKSLIGILVLGVAGALWFSCDVFSPADDSPKQTQALYVKFMNSAASEFTITDIELRPMGVAGAAQSTPQGPWGENILTDGTTLAPGDSTFFTLDIPDGHWSQYRLGVLDENGTRVMLHEQESYPTDPMLGSITHWGSDDRSVDVTVIREQSQGLIAISGWSDWAGID